MSLMRQLRREAERNQNSHLAYLGELLGRFYEFLSGYRAKTAEGDPIKECFEEDMIIYKPSYEQVRSEFQFRNKQWEQYCAKHKLMNVKHLFKANVAEAWKKHDSSLKK